MASICLRYINDSQDAMQVLNDGFLKVFKNIQTFNNEKAGLYTWMSRIMINTAIDYLRKRSIAYETNLSDIKEEAAIESSTIQKMDADALLSLIQKLPKATQLVFNLYTVDGFNHREISEILGISEGTSKWHLSEARKQLKKILLMRSTS